MTMRINKYKIVLKSSAGIEHCTFYDFLGLQIERSLNEPGKIEFELPQHHPALAALEDRSIVEVWRRIEPGAQVWTCLGRGLYQDFQLTSREGDVFHAACPGPLWLLSNRCVAYPPGISGRSLFNAPAGTIARTLVRYNATALAVPANGRLRSGGVNWITVEPDTGEGTPLAWSCSLENLLKTLQELASISGSDFDLEFNPPCGWIFRWYADGSGVDRSDKVVFSLENGSLDEPVLSLEQSRGRNAVIAACPDGEGGERYSISEGNWTIMEGDQFLEGRTAEAAAHFPKVHTQQELQTRGAVLLERFFPRPLITFHTLQTPAAVYQRDYFLGDTVTVKYQGAQLPHRIRQVKIKLLRDGTERIELACARD